MPEISAEIRSLTKKCSCFLSLQRVTVERQQRENVLREPCGAAALLKNLFGEQQMLALADYVQASLMLNYNGRRVG